MREIEVEREVKEINYGGGPWRIEFLEYPLAEKYTIMTVTPR